ncbi:MAG TPA: metal-sulfur cluster assembly factor [Trueperaceae bacterium]|nr:metal-sulfur cluster assembly factor [Trueperaceae bacterium]
MTETELTEINPAVPARNVLEALHAVIDPELGLDIVSLGMVYAVAVVDSQVAIEMTLTTPGCPLHGSIEADVRHCLGQVPGVGDIGVELVWDPPWTPDSMSAEAKRSLGFY